MYLYLLTTFWDVPTRRDKSKTTYFDRTNRTRRTTKHNALRGSLAFSALVTQHQSASWTMFLGVPLTFGCQSRKTLWFLSDHWCTCIFQYLAAQLFWPSALSFSRTGRWWFWTSTNLHDLSSKSAFFAFHQMLSINASHADLDLHIILLDLESTLI